MKRSPSFIMRRSDLHTLALLSGLTACYFVILYWFAWWLIPLACVLCVSACAAKHNHTHCATFGYRGLNRLMDFWLTALTGTSTSGIRVAHQILHHGNNQSPDDFVRCSLVANLSPGRALLRYVPLVVREVWRTKDDDCVQFRSDSLARDCLAERIFLWAIIGALLASFGPFVLLVRGIPWIFGQWFLIAMNLPQHDGCDAESKWAHSRNVTGRLANLLFLNNGFHTAHHIWPARHWSDLASLHSRKVAVHLPARLACGSLAEFWVGWWQERRKGGAI
jgi:fatty acid desaturase